MTPADTLGGDPMALGGGEFNAQSFSLGQGVKAAEARLTTTSRRRVLTAVRSAGTGGTPSTTGPSDTGNRR